MKKIRLGLVGVGLLVLLSAGRWDGSFFRVGTLYSSGTSNRITVGKAAYVKAECVGTGGTTAADTYMGVGNSGDAGCAPLADAGITCQLVRFSLGEKFYAQLNDNQDAVAALSNGSATSCTVFKQ